MTRQVQAHETSVSLVKAAPAELYAGYAMMLKVRVSCPSKCNLQGSKVKITDMDGLTMQEIELSEFDGAANETAEFALKAPTKAGEYKWTVVLAAHEAEGVLHNESATSLSFVVKPHITSMAVWDVPSPIESNVKFKIKVGVQCSALCNLAGRAVEILNDKGMRMATGTLGDDRWSDTGTLYWAEVEAQAPSSEDYYTWAAKFSEQDFEIPHEGAMFPFAFRTARKPEHVLTIEVLDKQTQTPINHADIVLFPYRNWSDERGVAKLRVPKGDYQLYVSAYEKKTLQMSVRVAEDVAIKAELLVAPVEDTSG